MEDQQITWSAFQSLLGDPKDSVELAERRNVSCLHSLQLQPQHVQHVCPFDGFFGAPEYLHSEFLYAAGEQRTWATHPDLRTELE